MRLCTDSYSSETKVEVADAPVLLRTPASSSATLLVISYFPGAGGKYSVTLDLTDVSRHGTFQPDPTRRRAQTLRPELVDVTAI